MTDATKGKAAAKKDKTPDVKPSETEKATPAVDEKSDEQRLAEAKKAAWDALPTGMPEAITALNGVIAEHNRSVAKIKASERNDPNLLLQEIREQNPAKDPQLAKFNEQITKQTEILENLVKQANEVAKKYLEKADTPEEINALKARVKRDHADLKQQIEGMAGIIRMMHSNSDLSLLINPIETQRGTSTASKSGAVGERFSPRLTRIMVNDSDQFVDQNGRTHTLWKIVDGVRKQTLTLTAAYLSKMIPKGTVTTKDISDTYLRSLEGTKFDRENLPPKHEFDFPYTYTDDNNVERTVNFKITTER